VRRVHSWISVPLATALGGWVIVVPPMTSRPHCKTVYAEDAPIDKWKRTPWRSDTSEQCERLLGDLVRRQMDPRRREAALAHAKELEAESRRDEAESREAMRADPSLGPSAAGRLPRRRKDDHREVCDALSNEFTHARCIEMLR